MNGKKETDGARPQKSYMAEKLYSLKKSLFGGAVTFN
jgi:hypothetical protein